MPAFPSVEWFDAVRHEFNTNDVVRTAGGGMCDARVGVKADDSIFLLVFEGFECSSASEIAESDLEDTDFYLDMPMEDWEDMLENIRENGEADLDHSLNTMDLDSLDGPRPLLHRRPVPPGYVLPLQPDVPVLLRPVITCGD